jgi:hypothetical protein
MLTFFDKFFWVVVILVTLGNAAAWRRRGKQHISADPPLAPGYRRLTLGFALWGNIPWVVMGLGVLAGGLTTRDYLRPWEGNPWVLAWYLTVILLWGILLWWVLRGRGAASIVAHPGLLSIPITRPKHVKLLALLGVAAGIVGIVVLLRGRMLVPYVTDQGNGYTTCFTVYDGYWRIVAWALLALAAPTVVLVVGITWIRRQKFPKWWNQKKAGKPAFLLVWSILTLAAAGFGFGYRIWQNTGLLRAYRSGNAQVVEGTVHVIHQQPATGHDIGDIVEVGGVQLEIDYYTASTAYSQTVAHGGVLTEGTWARLWYSGKDILRVDVTKEPSSRPVP